MAIEPSDPDDAARLEWRGGVENREIEVLHAQCFDHPLSEVDWRGRLQRFSLGWVSLRRHDQLIGFANVAWDGGVHGFLLDVMVAEAERRRGHGALLVGEAARRARAGGLTWLHVDFAPSLSAFYRQTCGFAPTDAGLIAL